MKTWLMQVKDEPLNSCVQSLYQNLPKVLGLYMIPVRNSPSMW